MNNKEEKQKGNKDNNIIKLNYLNYDNLEVEKTYNFFYFVNKFQDFWLVFGE